MTDPNIFRRLTAVVRAALAGWRVRRLVREARGCTHRHGRSAALAAVATVVGGLVLAHRIPESEALVRVFTDEDGVGRVSVVLTRGDVVAAAGLTVPFSCTEALSALAPAVERLARAEVAA